MCSRLIALITATTLLITSGCGLSTGEPAPPSQSPTFSGKGYACVGQIPDYIARYFNDELNDGQVTEFVSCLQKSFTSFAQLTRGRDENTYAPEEIRRFLQDYFFRERKISDKLMQEFMVIKQALVGGSRDRLTRTELYVIVEVLEDMRKEALRLKPHLQVLNPKLADRQNARDLGERLNRANDALSRTIQTFANRLSKSPQPYRFENLVSFLTEFRGFVNWDVHFAGAKPAADWVEMLRGFKEITVSPENPEGIGPREWEPLLGYMSRWYLSYLQYRVGVKDRIVDGVRQPTPILEGVGLQNTIFLADQIFRLIEEALSRQPARTITYAQILRLAESAQKLGWLNERIRMGGLQSALEATFSRIFGDLSAGSSARRVDGLKMSTISSMRTSFNLWAQIQQKLDAKFHPSDRREVPNVQPGLLNRDVRAKIEDMTDSDWDEFMKLKNPPPLMRPLFTENVSTDPNALVTVSLVYPDQLARYGLRNEFYNLSRMNLLRSGVTLVFRGYAEDGAVAGWQTGIKSAEMQKFYTDFKTIGVDLGLIDPRNENAGSRSFIEGNLFTYSSDGVQDVTGIASQLRFTEAMELAAYLWSGGMIANRLYEDMSKVCPLGPLDVKGQRKLDRCCVYAQLPGEFDRLFGNLPGFRDYFRSRSQVAQLDYVETLLNGVYSGKNSEPNWVEANELSTLAVVMHYAEAVMTRYDTNRDGRLDDVEVKTGALPVFNNLMRKIINETEKTNLSESEGRAVLLYILKYRQIPNKELWGDWGSVVWIRLLNEPEFSLDRRQLADVFRLIIGRLMNPTPKDDKPEASTKVKAPVEPIASFPKTVQQCLAPK